MEKSQKKLTFLKFSAYRLVMFAGFAGIILCAYFFGPMMWRFYIGAGNAFHYQGGSLAVHYLDVGEGDAIIIQLPDGRVAMIDSGTEFYYVRVKTYLVTRILKNADAKIDFLIATHSHDDHIGGFPKLLADFNVDTVYRPHNKSRSHFDTDILTGEAYGPLADTKIYEDFITAAYNYANQVYFIEAGIEIASESPQQGANFYSLYFHTPSFSYIRSLSAAVYQDFNDISPIISLRMQNRCFIFTGDAGTKTENQFRDNPQAIWIAENIGFNNLEVCLKVGHHGSNTSTSVNFLEFIKADKAVISVGERNTYGHPHPKVKQRLNAAGISAGDIFETSKLGNIVSASDGTGEKTYFAFDNEADLSLVYVLSASVLFFVCFADFKIVKQI